MSATWDPPRSWVLFGHSVVISLEILKPSSSLSSEVKRFMWIIRGEILLGSGFTVFGGFYQRVTHRFDFIVIGVTLILIGIVHLLRNGGLGEKIERYEGDRLLIRLRQQLSESYTVALDVPIGDHTVDYVVIGPPGVFLAWGWKHRGMVHGEQEDEEWTVKPPNSDERSSLDNPFHTHKETMEEVRSLLKDSLDASSNVPVYQILVLMYQNIEGSIRDVPACCTLGEVAGYILNRENESSISFEQRERIKTALSLSNY